jgi:ABC-2 type transport system ATP-binding protein
MTPSTPPALIQVQGLSRRYGDQLAVKNVDFTLRRGEVLGFLGPNGAGKSTTMRMLCGVLAPSAGEILIDGIDLLEQPRRARRRIGYLPENPPLYRDLTVDEYLHYCARLHGLDKNATRPAVERARARCGLTGVGRRLIGKLSKGYQQRVGIAQAILHDPALVVLDEPTVGLDPIQIREIRELIRSLGESHGVILSTHILPEVQSVCDRVQIIRNGELIFQTRIEELDRRPGSSLLRLQLRQPPPMEALERLPGVREAVALPRPGHFELRLEDSGEASDERIEQLAGQIVEAGWGLRALCPGSSSLEDLFIELATADEAELPSGEAA